jgi:hypothetical protein
MDGLCSREALINEAVVLDDIVALVQAQTLSTLK